jgi:hypothetical protein
MQGKTNIIREVGFTISVDDERDHADISQQSMIWEEYHTRRLLEFYSILKKVILRSNITALRYQHIYNTYL